LINRNSIIELNKIITYWFLYIIVIHFYFNKISSPFNNLKSNVFFKNSFCLFRSDWLHLAVLSGSGKILQSVKNDTITFGSGLHELYLTQNLFDTLKLMTGFQKILAFWKMKIGQIADSQTFVTKIVNYTISLKRCFFTTKQIVSDIEGNLKFGMSSEDIKVFLTQAISIL